MTFFYGIADSIAILGLNAYAIMQGVLINGVTVYGISAAKTNCKKRGY